jgi:iron complex outermembrane receptor protein
MRSENLRQDPRFLSKALPYRPEHQTFLRVAGGPKKLQGHVELLHQSAQFMNRTATVALPARARVNAGLLLRAWESSPRVELGVELKNALDVQTQDVDGYPLPGRSVFLTLNAALGAPDENGEAVR